MALPKIDLPVFELKLMSISEPIKFRPFLVKEEKLLLMALQSDEEETILKTIKQVINNCLVTEIDIDKLPIFDIEYLFLNLRARSIGEKVETYFLCRNIVSTKTTEEDEEETLECGHMMPVNVNVLNIKPPVANVNRKIMITDKIGIYMNFPSIKTLKFVDSVVKSDDPSAIFDLVYECADHIFDESGVYYISESPKEELDNFMGSLTQEQFDKITSFFEVLPKLEYDTDHTCGKCGFNHKLHLEGLSDFFI
jgi:hypothetical protein